jgi:hypothetical protein
MEPIEMADRVVPLIERGGVVAAVVISFVILAAAWSSAIYVLWRSREKLISSMQLVQKEHYKQVLAIDARHTELYHEIADTLKSHLEMMRTLCEKMAVLLDRDGRA